MRSGEPLEALSQRKLLMEEALLGHILQGVYQRPSLAVRPAEAVSHDAQHHVDPFMHVSVVGETSRFFNHEPERVAGPEYRHTGTLRVGTDNGGAHNYGWPPGQVPEDVAEPGRRIQLPGSWGCHPVVHAGGV